MKIIDRIFMKLEENNLKSVDLSSYLGINKSVISNWKARSTNPPSELIVPICKFLNVSTNYLLTGSEAEILEDLCVEHDLINMFRCLSEADREDVFEIVKLKHDRALKKGKVTSSYSAYTKTKEENNIDNNHNKNSGIA